MNRKKLPAFPIPLPPGQAYSKYTDECDGITMRDYFAAKAMALSFKRLERNYSQSLDIDPEWTWNDEDFEEIAAHSYSIADAMLRAREQQ